MASNSNPPASASQVLELQVHTPVPIQTVYKKERNPKQEYHTALKI